MAGTADSVDLEVASVSAGTITMAGVETINVTSSGGANVLTGLTATSATTLNISGSASVNMGTLVISRND